MNSDPNFKKFSNSIKETGKARDLLFKCLTKNFELFEEMVQKKLKSIDESTNSNVNTLLRLRVLEGKFAR